MRRIITLSAGLVALLLSASNGYADSFTVNFCPGAGCPANLTQAQMTFEEILSGSDPNDYSLTLTLVAGAGAPQLIDSVQFSITGVDTPTGYEVKPTLQTAPLGGSPWTVYWDMIAGNPGDCSADTSQGQGVCAQSTGTGVIAEGSNEWQFLVDLADDQAPLTVGSHVDFRAHFLKYGPRGAILPGGNLSPPGGGYLETGSNETSNNETSTNETSSVPEPAVLSLLGLALAAGAHRLKRRSAQQ